MRQTAMEKLTNKFLVPVLRFCGLYITEEGFLKNSNSSIYKNQEGKTFIIILNYQIYLYYLNNKDDLIVFNPFLNERHLFILMKFVRNTIFQLDEEFDEFFFEKKYDPMSDEWYSIEKNYSEEELFDEAEKRIKLLSYPADYKGNLRKRWVIATNLRNEAIGKTISEVSLPKDFNMNLNVFLSILQIYNYYDCKTPSVMDNACCINLANEILDLLNKVDREMKNNREKFKKEEIELNQERNNYSNVETDKFGNKTPDKHKGKSLSL